VVSELAILDEPRKRLAGVISGLDIHYDLGEGHPLLGRRIPDLDLITADGPLRVFALLHDARPLLFNFGEPGGFDITPWADRVRVINAEYAGVWELPVIGAVTAPTAVLIRPDGYVAWVGDPADPGLPDALTTWFGPPTAASRRGPASQASWSPAAPGRTSSATTAGRSSSTGWRPQSGVPWMLRGTRTYWCWAWRSPDSCSAQACSMRCSSTSSPC
jgi:hypothetical protein